MLENENVKEQYNVIKDLTSESYANVTMMNSLKMLGVKKSEAKEKLTEKDFKLVNEYKFPDRLVKMMELTTERFNGEGFFGASFARLALNNDHDIEF